MAVLLLTKLTRPSLSKLERKVEAACLQTPTITFRRSYEHVLSVVYLVCCGLIHNCCSSFRLV